ncbi:phage baseplate assembly protein [Sphingobium yanoikuyae]|uniref:Phage tail protein n=1 Tax=Sphingobium yanoikuyae TaxID=13690 RepID=A0A430BX01_SPHYA|nr:contractile injection system protein, VgrG/Pvc8 family [Sphingobium yanoikuyae]RSU57187.1 hypothetical protein DAH51_10265 [Sphingobium yanoikuyae]
MADLPDLSEKVELAIGGKLFGGWTGVSVSLALDAISGAFSLSLATKDDASGAPIAIAPDDRCQLRIAGEVVIDGWVDAVAPSISAQEHRVQVDGRDKTGDLADCSAIYKAGSWSNAKLETIAAALVRPFGISVTAQASTGAAIRKFAIQQGETVQAAIERLLRFRGLIAVASATGDLIITTPATGAPIAALELGINIKSANGRRDHRERFSDYVVKGQAQGDDQRHGKAASQVRGEAKDAGVRRYRPLLIVAEDQADTASAVTRAKFEAGVRAGRSKGVEIVVAGWRVAPKGQLWRPNLRVRVKCAPAGFPDDVLLITAVVLRKDSEGTTATLTCAPPEAMAQLVEKEGK